MATGMNPAAPHHLPAFITAPGESDIFLNGAAIFLVVMVIALGSVYFRLHALPEHMAHKNANKLQFEVVAVLALLALFTHNNVFWVAALLLALVPIPDFHGPLATMADSLARMAGYRKQTSAGESSDPSAETVVPATTHTDEVAAPAGRQVFSIAAKQSESASHDDDQSRGR
jgi:multisubunit Na+/H+ antiporter MnhF subunit